MSDLVHCGSAPRMHRVRFDTTVERDESVPGVLAKAARAQVLPRLMTVVRGAHVQCHEVGHVQLLPPAELRRLAYTLRCDADSLLENAGERVHSASHGATHQRARFGDLTLFRSDIELSVRRIAPTTLRTAGHHRVAWLNKLLPYCPISLERMVESCPSCSSPLGWTWSWGVSICETCEEVVPSSTEPALSPALTEDYRLFADLVSPLVDDRTRVRASLPERLQDVSYATLIRLAARIGLLCRAQPITNVRQHALSKLPAALLAEVVASGTAMLRDWPLSFRRFANGRADALRGNRDDYVEWRVLLRRLTLARTEGEELAGLVLEAMPDIAGPIERSFSRGTPHYVISEAQRVIGINHERLTRAIDARIFTMNEIPGVTRRRVQLAKAEVDEVALLIRGTPAINTVLRPFRMPLYGVEQLVTAGLLMQATNPAILVIREWPCLVPASIQDLNDRVAEVLRRNAPTEPERSSTMQLRAASRRIGGREKPWVSIIQAILNGDLRAWGEGSTLDTLAIRVRPRDMAMFDRVRALPAGGSLTADERISQDDAAELINTCAKYMPAVCAHHPLHFENDGGAQLAQKSAVIDVARQIASSAEIGMHLNVRAKSVETRMRDLRVPRIGSFWCRATLVDINQLPALE